LRQWRVGGEGAVNPDDSPQHYRTTLLLKLKAIKNARDLSHDKHVLLDLRTANFNAFKKAKPPGSSRNLAPAQHLVESLAQADLMSFCQNKHFHKRPSIINSVLIFGVDGWWHKCCLGALRRHGSVFSLRAHRQWITVA
jgi:hypothetical protein